MSPREAAQMDPQQRLLLEVAYEAIEDAGQPLDRLSQRRTGVFVGISTNDYAQIQSTHQERNTIDTYTTTGGVMSIVANRLSYCFDFKGPSLIVDTACSSSLVAAHLACRSLWTGESDVTIAAGINIIICPEAFIGFSRLSMLSPHGRCKAFDADGNGFVRAEGVGVVLLKPLSQALADDDPIYALIRATAINQDGRTNGITVPNEQAQAAMLREACQQAGIAPEQIQYIEAHGTGTLVGDPIEANALGQVLSANRPDGDYCRVGSVKTNIGHLEAGSGIAGLIKTALALHHGMIPPNLHFNTPNPYINFEQLKLRIQDRLEPWPQNGGGPRLAGVNSFGFGGTNAHVLLQGFEDHRRQTSEVKHQKSNITSQTSDISLQTVQSISSRPSDVSGRQEQHAAAHAEAPLPILVPLSARSPEALKALAQSYVTFLREQAGAISLAELAYNLSHRRTHHDYRLTIVAETIDELIAQLEAFVAGETRPAMRVGQAALGPRPPLVFVFSGQGPQWWGMGRQLLAQEPVFRQVIQECDELLRPIAPWSLLEELTKDEANSRMHETAISQPSIFAIQVALAALWRSWGIEPDAVIGHSVGEVAAAHIAGIYDLETALKVIYHRGRCMDLASSKGRMLGAGVTAEEALQLLQPYGERVSLAAINSPTSVTLSGEAEALEEIAQQLEQRQLFFSFLRVQYAFHSAQMNPVRDELLASLDGLRPQPAARLMYSTVTAQPTDGSHLTADYWWSNVRQSVRFGPAINGLIEQGYRHFVEISPHPVLAGYVNECLQHQQQRGLVIHSLRRQEPERLHLLGSLGALFGAGYPINWDVVHPERSRPLKLPLYPWQHQSYWHECETVKATRLATVAHPLLGHRQTAADPTWHAEVSRVLFPYLLDHRVQGHVVFPAACYIEMALAAAQEIFGAGTLIVEDVDFHRALFIPEAGPSPIIQTVVYATDSSFAISSRPATQHTWTLHATGKIRWEPAQQPTIDFEIEQVQKRCPERVSRQTRYQRFRDNGLEFGPCFQGVEQIWRRYGEAIGIVVQPEAIAAESASYLYHPAFLDGCFHVFSETVDAESDVCLPVQVEQIRFYHRPEGRMWSHAQLVQKTDKALAGNMRFFDAEGRLCMEIRRLTAQSIDTVRDISSESLENWIYDYPWRLKERATASTSPRVVDFLPPAAAMRDQLQAYVDQTTEELGWLRRFREIEPDLDRLCAAYVINAFRQLGWDFQPGDEVTIASLTERLGIIPPHHRVVGRYLDMLARDGYLEKQDQRWRVLQTPPPLETESLWRSLVYRFPAAYSESMLVSEFGQRLADLLTGRINPLHLLFPDGNQTTAEHHYQDSPSFKVYNLLAAKAVSLALDQLPEGRRVRILEIGAGTAGMTSYILPALPPDQVEYVLSDISPVFLHKAEDKFQSYPFLSARLLDIEKDPTEQGFTPHSFDFIIASDVLHATQDLRVSLQHVKQLLAPGGLFICLEVDIPVRWADLVFGLMEGWWRFTDTDLRPSYALLTRQRWIALFEEMGFSDPFAISDTDGVTETGQVVLFARLPLAADTAPTEITCAPAAAEQPSRRWLIFADEGGIAEQLADRLIKAGDQTTLVTHGESFQCYDGRRYQIRLNQPDDFEQLRQAVGGSLDGLIYCWSLDSPSAATADAAALERSVDLSCHSVLHLVQAWLHASAGPQPRLWLITNGAQPVGRQGQLVSPMQSPLIGLGRVISNELPEFECRLVDLSPTITPRDIDSLCEELLNPDEENEIALRGAARYVSRVARASLHKSSARAKKQLDPQRDAIRLQITTPGVLDDLMLTEVERRQPQADEVEIQVRAVALNFRDVMKALGIYPTDGDDYLWLGDECAGVITAVGDAVKEFAVGDEVMAIAPQSFGSFVITKAAFVARKPAHLSFEEAATVPIAFLTAHYALSHLGRLTAGERVLIQAGTGGVGLAAIQLAQRAGAEIFATAGTPQKRAFLKALGVAHVMDSRSLAFADEIHAITNGRGVDLVLNSLAGEAIAKGLASLAPYGRFLEIGKRDIYQNSKLGLRVFKNNLSFFAIDLARVMADRPSLIASLLRDIVGLLEQREIHPLPYRVFTLGDAIQAFRHMAQAKHVGKIIVSLSDKRVPVEPLVEQTISFSPESSYLIVGGTSGLGLAIAAWMSEHGARHLALMSRSGPSTDEAQEIIGRLEQRGLNVRVFKGDVSRATDVERVIAEIDRAMPPLRGVIHSALVLDDGVLMQQTTERFKKVMQPKVAGAWHLHRLTQDRPLDFFIMFSSLTSILGNPAQSNYAAANAFLDAMAYYRRTHGLPALTINWGRVADTGYVARHEEIGQHVSNFGFKGFTARQAAEAMARLMLKHAVHAGVMNVDWRQWSHTVAARTSPRFSLLVNPHATDQQTAQDGVRLRDLVMAAEPADRQPLIEAHLKEQVARVLGASAAHLDAERPLNELGLDSLMAVELKNRIEKEIGVTLPTVELMRGPTVLKLSHVVLKLLTGADAAAPTEADIRPSVVEQQPETLLQQLDQLSEQDVDQLLSDLVDENELAQLLDDNVDMSKAQHAAGD
ncbi:MAG: SDR family NAD(P)-dependent oxidoreductase [Blastocatellia bacterium]|nr:SDR family NAD(P)-dependent oxidoreductase [Blastocatellia bacterium]